VLDMTVGEFVEMHARSHGRAEAGQVVERVVEAANGLCGEPFDAGCAICELSGGQSRSLMIADVGIVSDAPVVLIDELENAGVDKRRALDLLVRSSKVVVIATHDPTLMLLGTRRVVMAGGAVSAQVRRSEAEARSLLRLEEIERGLGRLREGLRRGGTAEELPDEIRAMPSSRGVEGDGARG
jgi:ABC-type lipoprotein export system ATPase subunit